MGIIGSWYLYGTRQLVFWDHAEFYFFGDVFDLDLFGVKMFQTYYLHPFEEKNVKYIQKRNS